MRPIRALLCYLALIHSTSVLAELRTYEVDVGYRQEVYETLRKEKEKVDEETVHAGETDDLVPKVVRDAVDALPERLRRVLLLTEMAGMTYTEVAATLGVKVRLYALERTRR